MMEYDGVEWAGAWRTENGTKLTGRDRLAPFEHTVNVVYSNVQMYYDT